MNKEQMIKIILAYANELHDDYIENRKAFGYGDKDTERAGIKWIVIEDLLTRLNLTK